MVTNKLRWVGLVVGGGVGVGGVSGVVVEIGRVVYRTSVIGVRVLFLLASQEF